LDERAVKELIAKHGAAKLVKLTEDLEKQEARMVAAEAKLLKKGHQGCDQRQACYAEEDSLATRPHRQPAADSRDCQRLPDFSW